MKLSGLKIFTGFFLAFLISAPAWATPAGSNTALPGTLNYVEGQAAIGSQTVGPSSIGQMTLQSGQSLTTEQGKAEILLTPGVFLRLGDHSSASMISPNLTNTQVQAQGLAMVEVAQIYPQNNLRIIADNVPTQLLKNGLYEFDSAQGQVRVFKGKAVVFDGDREIKVDGGHELDLNATGKLKARKFDKKKYEQSDLYRWSSLRSSYLAEANVETAQVYVANGWYGPGWFGGGWYWSPWLGGFTFIPADGILLSPFGFGFYSPLIVFQSPFFRGHAPFVHPGVLRSGRVVSVGRPSMAAHSGFESGLQGGMNGGFHGGMAHR